MRNGAGVGVAGLLLVIGVAVACARAIAAEDQESRPPAAAGGGWQIPPEAKTETNPVQQTPETRGAGRALFEKHCKRCHGPEGKGDGPDADMDHMDDMNLTDPDGADENPDGVVFYKVWNGRRKPKMPAFKTDLTREQVWTIVGYVQTLRSGS